MQNLILEVLNAQPSLRDSKQYLNSFGPKVNGPQAAAAAQKRQTPPFQPQAAKSRVARAAQSQRQRLQNRPPSPDFSKTSSTVSQPPQDSSQQSNESPSTASSSKTRLEHIEAEAVPEASTESDVASAAKDGTQAYLESATSVSIQQHTALVKVQGPFTTRQLESIADGMVYLKKLGLVSVIVVEGEGWSQPGYASEFTPDGILRDNVEEQEDRELAPWTGDAVYRAKQAKQRELRRKRQVSLRRAMLQDVQRLSEMLQERGASARPFLSPLLRVAPGAAQEAERSAPRHFPGVGAEATASAQAMQAGAVIGTGGKEKGSQASPLRYKQLKASTERSPLVSDDGLSNLRAALATDHIPIIAPLALYADPEEGGAEKNVPVKADDVLVALARDMAIAGKEEEELASRDPSDTAQVDMMPLRLMVINREGGPPSHARGGNPHLAINLASEYAHIRKSFIWDATHPTALSNLQMVHDCLSYMPHTSSGIIVSHRSPRSLIANLITNKAAHSPSLPHALLASRQDVRHTPTIIRPGLSIRVIQDFSKVDRPKLTSLLEASFRRKLDAESYYRRLEEKCDFVIVTGDYQGAAIVTKESTPDDGPDDEPIAYLDKFAVLPQLQGSGTVDFLWGALRDEVQGLGLLDALNDNGGKGGFGKGRDLVWKSRADNPVNRWYFERSNGFVKVDTTLPSVDAGANTDQKKLDWMLFWCDAEERLSKMSGERRLGASASPEDVLSSMDDDGDVLGSNYYDGEDDDFVGLRDATLRSRSRSTSRPRSPFEQKLAQLDPRPGGANQRLLPVIAPDEQGRLERWARCMCYIPSAWA